jgi:superfamily II RNA helicase
MSTLKYVIVDEIHNITEVGRGAVYERVLSLVPCPMICLSATIGNAAILWDWLRELQEAKGMRMAALVHSHRRWSDLQLQVYAPDQLLHTVKESAAKGDELWQLGCSQKLPTQGHDLMSIHPIGLFATHTGTTALLIL